MNSNTKKIVVRYVFWAAAVLIMVFIFWNSAQTAEQSTVTSESFTEKLLTVVLPSFSDLGEAERQTVIADMQFIVRKSAHFLVYFALGVCCFSAINTYQIKTKNKVLTAIIICLLYATSDEIHQLFVVGRAGRATDVMIDLVGAVLGILLTLSIVAAHKKRKINKGEYPVKKKELVEKLNQLIDSMNSLQRQLLAVQGENGKLKAELKELRSKTVETAPAVTVNPQPDKEPVAESKGFTVKDIDLLEPQKATDTAAEPVNNTELEPVAEEKTASFPIGTETVVLADEAMEYGSIAIGKVVQESIKYANIISSSGSDSMKELLNLIMGRGEVAKAEIFSIAEGDSPINIKRELMDRQVLETVDYFKSVAGQI